MKSLIIIATILLGGIVANAQKKLNVVKNINNINIYNIQKYIDNGFTSLKIENGYHYFSNCSDTILFRFDKEKLVSISFTNEKLANVENYEFKKTNKTNIFSFVNEDYAIAKKIDITGNILWVYYSTDFLSRKYR